MHVAGGRLDLAVLGACPRVLRLHQPAAEPRADAVKTCASWLRAAILQGAGGENSGTSSSSSCRRGCTICM